LLDNVLLLKPSFLNPENAKLYDHSDGLDRMEQRQERTQGRWLRLQDFGAWEGWAAVLLIATAILATWDILMKTHE
jgi:hypothetical protein